MRWIAFEGKKPTDTDIPSWAPWTQEKWDEWLFESARLCSDVAKLEAERQRLDEDQDVEAMKVKLKERNDFIDKNSEHWGMLKPWLSAISHGKCWFTEARDLASHFDVEHYRPKKAAKDLDGTERDGYWWLAFDYTNYRFAGNVPNRMKGGWFPLHEGSQLSTYAARCEESETVYLLDPIEQLDVDMLAFDEEGNAIPVPGMTDAWELERVEVSIKRLKLNEHDALPDARRKVWKDMDRAIDGFLTAKHAYKPGINPVPKATMKERAKEIRHMTLPETELSSTALWCLRFRNDPDLLRLAA